MSIVVGRHALIEDPVKWLVGQGSDASLSFVLRDSEGNAQDLTGWEARSQVRPKIGSAEILADLSTETGTILISGGSVTAIIPAAISSTWGPKRRTAVFDIELYPASGGIVRLCSGVLDVSPEVTIQEV